MASGGEIALACGIAAGIFGGELVFAYRTGSVHRGNGGLIHRATEPQSYWRNVYLGIALFALFSMGAVWGVIQIFIEGF